MQTLQRFLLYSLDIWGSDIWSQSGIKAYHWHIGNLIQYRVVAIRLFLILLRRVIRVDGTYGSGNHICIYQVLIRNAHPTMQINNLFHREMTFTVKDIADSTFGAKELF